MKRLGAVFTLALLLASCSTPEDELVVATSSYPMTFIAEEITAGVADVLDLSTSGGEAHDLELSPRQVAQLARARFVLYLGNGFQPAVEHAVHHRDGPGLDALDAVPEADLREGDPHVWLSPLLMADIGEQLAAELSQLDPEYAEKFAANALILREEMEALHAEYAASLDSCAGETLLASHEAFGYLADAYKLEQVGVLGVSPEAEPSPKRLQEVLRLADEKGTDTLFIESSDSSGQKLADSLRLRAVPLNTLEVAPAEGDYLSVMRENLSNLQDGLGCEPG